MSGIRTPSLIGKCSVCIGKYKFRCHAITNTPSFDSVNTCVEPVTGFKIKRQL